MKFQERYMLTGFYQNELKQNILDFWIKRCEDKEFGGFLNCFDNRGENLVSYDKYAWSQGRFVWMFARLASTDAPIFSNAEREEYFRLAKQGAEFLMRYSLIGKDDWRTVFLMERDGAPKEVSPGAPLDMSIYADCFVIIGLAMFAYAGGGEEAYKFAKHLYESAVERIRKNDFRTLPYPLSSQFKAHGIPMIMSNVTRELYRTAELLDKEYCESLKSNLQGFVEDILYHFVDEDDVMHEILRVDNTFFPQLLGQHMNPGHTLEDVWFMLDAAELCEKPEWREKIFRIAKQALKNGWDEEFGGLVHFCGINGGAPEGDNSGVEDEPMSKQLADWDCKLWWVHSEALYSTLRCYYESKDLEFLDWHDKLFEYVFRTFPNRDIEVREWMQIRQRDGAPQEKVVALPVKDPFHITRNLILILELLFDQN